MRIGILTFHYAHNYGAVLQAYASKIFLETLGHEVFFIDYKPQCITAKYKVFTWKRFFAKSPISTLRKLKHELPLLKARWEKYQDFEEFISNVLLDKGHKLSHFPTDLNNLDCYFLGSDQIWNISILGYFDKIYWGNITPHKPMISYAVSLENDIPNKYHDIIKSSLAKFNFISVRENIIQELLYTKFQIHSQVAVDPTFLLEPGDWRKLEKPLDIPEKFVLVYYFGVNSLFIDRVQKFATQNKCKLIVISIGVSSDKRFKNRVSPENFIYLFDKASFVITNSFHGTAFSIIFQRPFYTFKKKSSSNYRIEQLCSICGLSNRIIEDFNELTWDINVNIRKSFSENILSSKKYIIDSLKKI